MSSNNTAVWEGAPPEVRQWLMEKYSCFLLVGFDSKGEICESVFASDDKDRFALYQAMTRAVERNKQAIPVRTD